MGRKKGQPRLIHGGTGTKLFSIWQAMRQRCENPNDQKYRWYGAKGIEVCAEWREFAEFRSWAQANGYREGLTIDRVHSGGPYAPDNCRWVTRSQNAINRGDAYLHDAFGEAKTLREWAADPRCLAGTKKLIETRLARGWSLERALATPVQQKMKGGS